jgi:release factor glutamine methyltransferase
VSHGGPLRTLLQRIEQTIAAAPALEVEVRADAAREARLLMAGVLDCSLASLAQRLVADGMASAPEPLPVAVVERLEGALFRRLRGEPLAYVLGSAAFRELELQVDARVLIPRPETEVVVGEALRVTGNRPGGLAVDVGTGSGAIALSLAIEGAFDAVVATDISADALEVAAANAAVLASRCRCPVSFEPGADLAPLMGRQARVIVSNPPYIAYHEAAALPPSVRDWEPPTALFAAEDGMARYWVLIDTARNVLESDGWLVLELDARRSAQTAVLAVAAKYQDVQVVQDLSGRDRVLVARWPGWACAQSPDEAFGTPVLAPS